MLSVTADASLSVPGLHLGRVGEVGDIQVAYPQDLRRDSPSSPKAGVEDVPDSVPEKVETERDDEYREARK